MEFFVYAMISAAISAFQARPDDVIMAGKRNLFIVGRTSIRNFLAIENSKTFVTSRRLVSIDEMASTVLCQIIGKTIMKPIATVSVSPSKISHRITINEATGVERMTVIIGANMSLISARL